MKSVVILGSAPDAIAAQQFDLERVDALVALNNAWQIRSDWTHAIFPEDFPVERRPGVVGAQQLVTHRDYVPANNAFGGIIYAGATMVFTAAYWVLHHFKPDAILFCGCDMVYDQPDGKSHFYGSGEADPLRDDPTLQSLPAKSNRLMLLAAQQDCLTANLSELPVSRLTFPRINPSALDQFCPDDQRKSLIEIGASVKSLHMQAAQKLEKKSGLLWETGDYWNADFNIDRPLLARIDDTWKSAIADQSDVVIV